MGPRPVKGLCPFVNGAFLVAQLVKNLPATQNTRVRFLGQEDPLEKKWKPTPVFLPGESHGQRSFAGYSPWSCKSWTRLSNSPITTTTFFNVHSLQSEEPSNKRLKKKKWRRFSDLHVQKAIPCRCIWGEWVKIYCSHWGHRLRALKSLPRSVSWSLCLAQLVPLFLQRSTEG